MKNCILFNRSILFNRNDYFLFLVTYKLALKAEKEAVASSESENEGQLRKKKLNIINIWIMSILLSLQDWSLHARNQMTQIS